MPRQALKPAPPTNSQPPARSNARPCSLLLSVSKTPEGSAPVLVQVTGERGAGGGQQIGASATNFNCDLSGFAARPEGPMNARTWKQWHYLRSPVIGRRA